MAELRVDPKQESLRELYRRQSEDLLRQVAAELEQQITDRVAALDENDPEPLNYIKLAACYVKSHRHAEAVELLQKGLKRCQPSDRLYYECIEALSESNRTQEAIHLAEEASRQFPDKMTFRLREHLLLPILYDTTAEIDYYRERFRTGIEKLRSDLDLNSADAKKNALDGIADYAPFYLAYQGRDVLQLQRQYGAFVGQIMSANYPEWTQPIATPAIPADGKLRVGYVSAHFREHSVAKDHLGWLQGHDPKRFEVYAYSMGTKSDSTTEGIPRMVTKFWRSSGDFSAACRAIFDDQLHVLVYLDIGMTPVMAQLAALRLAPVQCVTWGHPITSGLRTMDYFLSSELMEPADGAEHYSENLIRLPGIGICYEKPIIPTILFGKSRSDFGLREDGIVYLSCQSIYKYLPEHDHVFAEIAAQVPQAQFIFLTPNKALGEDFMKRLDRVFSPLGLKADERCVLAPPQNTFNYWNLNVISDVYLDTIEWSGCNSTMEAIACKLPVVTVPGRFMRGRHSAAMLTQLGMTETIARDKHEYVSIAVRLGLDKQWRERVAEKMVAGYQQLYSDPSSVTALEDFYRRAVEKRL